MEIGAIETRDKRQGSSSSTCLSQSIKMIQIELLFYPWIVKKVFDRNCHSINNKRDYCIV
jgi:hypothetical protein